MAKSYDEIADELMTPDEREQAQELARKDMARYLVAEIQGDCGRSLDELAHILNVERADLIQPPPLEIGAENWEDGPDEADLVRALSNVVTALGGKLHMTAVFPGGEIRLTQPATAASKAALTPTETAAA